MRLLFTAGLLCFLSRAQEPDDFASRLIAFNKPYAAFARIYSGCALDETEIANCRPLQGKIDQQLFHNAREAAKKLFDLEERR